MNRVKKTMVTTAATPSTIVVVREFTQGRGPLGFLETRWQHSSDTHGRLSVRASAPTPRTGRRSAARSGERLVVLVLTTVDPERLARARAASEFVWIDLAAPDAATLDALGAALPVHPLALADTREFAQRPKLDRYDDATLIVLFGARTVAGDLAVPVEVHVHVAADVLVTAHPDPLPEFVALQGFLAADPPRPEDAIVLRVLDALMHAVEAAIERQDGALERLEDRVLQQTRREQLGQIVRLKHAIGGLQRRIEGERDVFGATEQTVLELPDLDPAARPYLRDISNRLARADGRLAAQQAAAASLTDTYFNANANRLTELSERLSVIATILLPLTIVTGFFGQNFGWLVDHIDSLTAFLVFGVGGLIVPPVLAVAYLRRRGSTPR